LEEAYQKELKRWEERLSEAEGKFATEMKDMVLQGFKQKRGAEDEASS